MTEENRHDAAALRDQEVLPDTATAQKPIGLLFRLLISVVATSIFAGMILDGGAVSMPSIIGAWVVSAVVFGIVAFRRGEAKATALDRLLVVLSPPVVFALFMLVLPAVWHWRGLM